MRLWKGCDFAAGLGMFTRESGGDAGARLDWTAFGKEFMSISMDSNCGSCLS